MYRKFWLENALGNTFQMSDRAYNHFLNAPNNLGFAKDISTIRLGNVEQITTENYQLLTPQGELIFYGDNASVYQDYFDYIQFIRYQPLRLYYLPSNVTDPYYIEGNVIQTDKSEIAYEDSTLHCPFYFKATTPWQTSTTNVLVLTSEVVGDGKSYPLSYPYHYAGNSLSDVSVNNNGSLSTGFIVEINGEVTNPQWSVFDEYGNLYGMCRLNGTFDYARVNSVDGEESIYLENDGSVIANPSSYQDLSIADGNSYITFIKLKVGLSKLTFSLGDFDGSVKIQWRNVYASV